MMRIFAVIALALFPTLSMAELPEPRMVMVGRGVVCDTKEEVETLLTQISLNNGKPPDSPPSGCGFIRRPVPFMVTPLGWYETPFARTLLARMTAPNGWTQYGWMAFEPNPNFVPEPEGEAL